MKRIKRLLATLIILSILSANVGCVKNDGQTDGQEEKLSIYLVKGSCLIHAINDYNENQKSAAGQIEVTTFSIDDYENMNKKITNELLAGEGPDLFYFYDSDININQLVSQGAFQNVKELGIELPYDDEFVEYHSIVPISYTIPLLFTSKAICGQYGINREKAVLSLEDLFMLGEKGIPVIAAPNDFLDLVYEDYIDFDKNQNLFKGNEFQNLLARLGELGRYDPGQNDLFYHVLNSPEFRAMEKDEVMFAMADMCSSPMDVVVASNQLQREAGKELEVFGFASDGGQVRAYAYEAVAINANSEKTKAAAAFVEYLLSNEVQGCTKKGDTKILGIPVSEESRNADIELMIEAPYKEDYIDIDSGITLELQDKYKMILDRVTSCVVRDNIYYYNIFDELAEKYKDGEISIETFIEELDKKTQLYLNE